MKTSNNDKKKLAMKKYKLNDLYEINSIDYFLS